MIKLRSGQGNRYADTDANTDDAADAADQSNTYMSPVQATEKLPILAWFLANVAGF